MCRQPDGSGGPHVFVADLSDPVISAEDLHHLSNVRRIKHGSAITLSDGAGRWCPAVYAESAEITGPIVAVNRPEPAVTIAMSPVKGDRTAVAVQKLTELGIDRIIMLVAARSVVRWDADRAEKAMLRLNAVARSAASQSRQVWLPTVDGPTSVSSVLAAQRSAGTDVAAAEHGGVGPSLGNPTVLVGPEGGWESGEIEADVTRVGLGSSVLRAETAAIVAGALLASLRNGLVRSHSE